MDQSNEFSFENNANSSGCSDFYNDNKLNSFEREKNKPPKTEINNKELDDFIENFVNFFEYYYRRVVYIIQNKIIKKYPKLNLEGGIESHKKFLEEINAISSNVGQEEIIIEALVSKIYKVLLFGKLSVSAFDFLDDSCFDSEAHYGNKKEEKNRHNYKKNYFFSSGILKLGDEINALKDNYLEVLNSLKNDFNFQINDFDSRGDFLIPNTNNITKRGKEDYYPAYGWIGIGLNVSCKYEEDGYWIHKIINSKWANAYLGFRKNPNNRNIVNIKDYLYDLISNNDKIEIFERKVDFKDDTRHLKKKYEKGIFLHSKIENAEKDAGLINIKNENNENKTYKVLLMARVKIDEISQPKNEDFWVLGKQFIRIYRILFKEIRKCSNEEI